MPVIGRGTRLACGLWFPSSAPPWPRAVPPFETAKCGAAQGMDGSQGSRVDVISGFRRSGPPANPPLAHHSNIAASQKC